MRGETCVLWMRRGKCFMSEVGECYHGQSVNQVLGEV